MAIRTPEHAPHLPHIPLPDIRGAARWLWHHKLGIAGSVIGGVATGGGIGFAAGPDQLSAAKAAFQTFIHPNKAAVTDVYKEPEVSKGGGFGLAPDPIPPSNETSSNPGAVAVDSKDAQSKKPEVEGQRGYIGVSREEAQELVEEARQRGEAPILFPFDVSANPNITITEADKPNVLGEGNLHYIYANNLTSNPTAASSNAGEFRINHNAGGNTDDIYKLGRVTSPDTTTYYYMPDADSPFGLDNRVSVSPGVTVINIKGSQTLSPYFNEAQVALLVKYNGEYQDASKFVQKDGKTAYVNTTSSSSNPQG